MRCAVFGVALFVAASLACGSSDDAGVSEEAVVGTTEDGGDAAAAACEPVDDCAIVGVDEGTMRVACKTAPRGLDDAPLACTRAAEGEYDCVPACVRTKGRDCSCGVSLSVQCPSDVEAPSCSAPDESGRSCCL